MILTAKQKVQLEEKSAPLIEWLAENFHPHVKVIVDYGSAEILESSAYIKNEKYIK